MDIEFSFNASEDCCHVRVFGDVYPADVMRSFHTAFARPDYTSAGRALWDYSGARMRLGDKELEPDDVTTDRDLARTRAASKAARDLADFAQRELPERLPPRVALVAGSDIDLGMMRVYLGYAAFDGYDIRIFKSDASARGWLFGDD